MTQQVLGPKGSPRRRWTLLLPFVVALSLGLFYIAGAQAVHDVGTFELEGNAVNDADAGDDWENVCKRVTVTDDPDPPNDITDECTGAAPASGATSVAFASEPDHNATIFTGGGSKDPEGLDQWAWKDDAGGLPDKDNLLHAFAARYVVPQADTTPATSCPTSIAGTTCDIIYFGSDRFDNSGDAVQGFWFLQNKVELGSNKIGGGQGFSGLHKPGDLLVLSDFSNGGDVSTIRVFKWVASGGDTTTHLDLLAESTDAECSDTLGPDPFCGIVNPEDGETAPWSFLDKSGNSTFLQGELFEAGINLSSPDINLSGVCFASLVSETRASTSPTATLKDFVLSPFGECAASLVTTPSNTTATPVAPGTLVSDLAVVTGTSGGSPPNPSSPANIVFSICGPISSSSASSTWKCDGSDSAHTAVAFGATKPLVHCLGAGNPAVPAGLCTAADAQGVSRARSDTISKTAPGVYCFKATWAGDANYTAGASDIGSNGSECFRVQDTSSMTTAQNWLPNDSATVTSANGTALSGSVVFTLYDGAITCSNPGSATVLYGPETKTLSSAASPAQVSTGNTSNTITVASNKTVTWRVVFTSSSGDVASPASATCETSVLTITN